VAAYFALTETAFSCLNKYRFQVKKDHGSKTASLVLWIADRFDHTLVTVLIGTNIASVVLSVISTILFTKTFMPGVDTSVSSLVSTLVMAVILYIFGETIPKQIGKKIPNKVASIVVYPLVVFFILVFPISIIFTGISKLAKKLFPSKEEPEITEEDFTSLIELNEKKGLIEENESDVIINSIDFSDTKVKEVLTSKRKMFTIDLEGKTNEDVAAIVCDAKYSRIPVYRNDQNKIIGILIVKEFLSRYLRHPDFKIEGCLETPYIVSPNVNIDDLTDGFRIHQVQCALVYKKEELIGLVTLEDVLEELIGPMSEKEPMVRGGNQ